MRSLEWKENFSWKYMSLIIDEQVISLQRTRVHDFSDSVWCLGEIHGNPQSLGTKIGLVQNISGTQRLGQN